MDLCELLGHALATGCSLSSMLALVITLISCRHCILWQFLLCCIALAVALLLHWCLQVEDRGLASISQPGRGSQHPVVWQCKVFRNSPHFNASRFGFQRILRFYLAAWYALL